jgi:hypothetical protein
MRLGHDCGREQETLDQWVRKIVVDVEPTTKISGYAPDVQAAIRQGRVMAGMTREQTLIAVGYLLTCETPLWGSDGPIREISAVDTVRNAIIYQPASWESATACISAQSFPLRICTRTK